MKITIIAFSLAGFLLACGGATTENKDRDAMDSETMTGEKQEASEKGIGEVKHVELNTPLKADMVERGKAIYEMKCAACHKLTSQRVVGPGWEDITSRRTPEWIMNMTTNVDIMLAEDPVAQKLLEECLVRMPDQNLSVEDSRDVLEYMYFNDGHEVAAQ